MPPSKRRQQIETMLESQPDDTFLLYGLAMEYLKEGEIAEGTTRLKSVAEKSPDYVAAYFQLGQALVLQGEIDEAKVWLERGIEAARATGNSHALGEMQQYLMTL